ncbi:unnamed protein product [Didymodactylos carnosus]|uniref:Uncharacterized protein n=1 Tax=Didymodactylos carnosus TaxID=1234261 RepID=A0A814EDP8_9BILA|nr:unnamed protein product [Didymodactylos carnosus]CAF0967473.1 unnamed protein product [Didymodactylos carnosus]CAF3618267.1 unnamed protein product [Didymodactylos carnosus]CAF3740857.1 unnamed protein product [Didymodactylos carnosus]
MADKKTSEDSEGKSDIEESKSSSDHLTTKSQSDTKINSDKSVDNAKTEEKEDRTVEEIDKELDNLRPKPPSPETKKKILIEEQKYDAQKSNEEEEKSKKKDSKDDQKQQSETSSNDIHKLTPNQPDPSVENIKIPVLTEDGHIELKLQQGSTLSNKTKDSNQQLQTDSSDQIMNDDSIHVRLGDIKNVQNLMENIKNKTNNEQIVIDKKDTNSRNQQ